MEGDWATGKNPDKICPPVVRRSYERRGGFYRQKRSTAHSMRQIEKKAEQKRRPLEEAAVVIHAPYRPRVISALAAAGMIEKSATRRAAGPSRSGR